MHAIEAAGCAIAQDDAALVERRTPSPLWARLRARTNFVAGVVFYTLVVVAAVLSFIRSRAARAVLARIARH